MIYFADCLFLKLYAAAQSLSCVQLFVTPWTIAHQAPLSTGFPRQEYWSGLPLPTPANLPKPGIQPVSLVFCNSSFKISLQFLQHSIL